MGNLSLNPLKFFTENCKTYRNLAKPVTPVTFSFSVKFINNTFDKFNNIYYYFLMSGASIESHPGKLLNKKNILLQIKFTAFLKVFLEFCNFYNIQMGTMSIERSFSDHQLFIETF